MFLLFTLTMISFGGCKGPKFTMPFDADSDVSGFHVTAYDSSGAKADTFASGLCVVAPGEAGNLTDGVDMSRAEAAVLFDVNNSSVLYSKNAHEKLYPASLTKVMTALVALKYSSLDKQLVATDAVNITESGAQLCGLKSGDSMTMDQALHVLLMYSANDVAMLIADNIGGTLETLPGEESFSNVEKFMSLMNREAAKLGATNTHFMNPHGLTDPDHYTTAYDLYLIFKEAVKYDIFNEIIHMASYQTTYYDKDGKEKTLEFGTTNRYLKGNAAQPTNVTVIGGKTGTTNAAGHCLIILSKDTTGAPYISAILRSESTDVLYQDMTNMLDKINK